MLMRFGFRDQVLKRDPDGQDKAPEVIKEEIQPAKRTNALASTGEADRVPAAGYKFDLPALPLPSKSHLRHRYEPLVEQVTNLMMRDGKKSVAQRVGPSVIQPTTPRAGPGPCPGSFAVPN